MSELANSFQDSSPEYVMYNHIKVPIILVVKLIIYYKSHNQSQTCSCHCLHSFFWHHITTIVGAVGAGALSVYSSQKYLCHHKWIRNSSTKMIKCGEWLNRKCVMRILSEINRHIWGTYSHGNITYLHDHITQQLLFFALWVILYTHTYMQTCTHTHNWHICKALC